MMMKVGFTLFVVFCLIESTSTSASCNASDKDLKEKRDILCKSLVGGNTSFCENVSSTVKASGDWPSQAVYFHRVLDAMTDNTKCRNTSYYARTAIWLNSTILDSSVSGNFGWTWSIFQVQYYDMPRKPGDRIEAPDTLGRKCWAFAYLKQMIDTDVVRSSIPFSMEGLIRFYDTWTEKTMRLCAEVQENCFVNASYDPSRNGTCGTKQFEFHYLGFDRENLKRLDVVKYPFYY